MRLLSNLNYCLKNALECWPPLIFLCVFSALINAVLPVLSAFMPAVLIEIITDGGAMNELVAAALSFSLAITVLSAVARFAERYNYHQKYRLNSFYLRRVAHKGLICDYANLYDERFRRLQSEAFACCNGNYSAFSRIFDASASLVTAAAGAFAFGGILAALDYRVLLLIAIVAAAEYFISTRVSKWAEANRDERMKYQAGNSYITRVSDDVTIAKDIRLYSMARWLGGLFNDGLKGLSEWYKRYAKKVFGVSVSGAGLALLREGATYSWLLYMAAKGELSAARFALCFGAVAGFSVWLSGILGRFTELRGLSLNITSLREYLDFPDTAPSGNITSDGLLSVPKTLELKNVCFKYDGAEDYVLRDINLTVSPGEHIAVVGLNGAGKTTLVKLITGMLTPNSGEISYGGVNISEFDRGEYLRLFSAVFQQFSLLPVKICELVAGEPSDALDRKRVAECINTAGLTKKLASLPNGIDSEYGKTVADDGAEFSGGETQKLLLARAIYKSAPFLILDEPTAALDPVAEGRLYESYADIMRDRSGLFISHRLAGTRFCDRILLLDGGVIAEEGTHESLMAQRGAYFAMFETQAKLYRDNECEADA